MSGFFRVIKLCRNNVNLRKINLIKYYWKLDLPIEKIKVIHIEPVKFQYDGLPFPLNNHYNRNLKAVLDTLVSMGRIKIGDIIPQYWGHNNSLTSKSEPSLELLNTHTQLWHDIDWHVFASETQL